jgi:CubicO group peptidase (beta-lactamase class C family)
MAEVDGEVMAGFEPVREAFRANFVEHGDLGAACAVYVRGTKVVDLWGGVADERTGRPWQEDTLQLVFSTTKGATAICAHVLAERGELDFDAPVASYWPEFAAAGKGEVPVRWLLSHRVGLPALAERTTPEVALDWDAITELLANETPLWEPGSAHGYHALTYGWLVGEVIRRVSGRPIGQFFAEEVAGPLGLEFWIGLPESAEPRVARLVELAPIGGVPEDFDVSALPPEQQAAIAHFADPEGLAQRALRITEPPLHWNDPAVHRAQIPAANGICTARSLARMYAAVVGEVDGVRLLEPKTVERATEIQSDGPDRVLFAPTRFGLGFMLSSEFSPFGGPRSFGHPGAGGSVGFADPEGEWSFGYVMNKMATNLAGDPRTRGLIEALEGCL